MQEYGTQRFNPDPQAGLSQEQVKRRREQGLSNTQPELITKTIPQIISSNLFTLFNAFNIAIGICIALVGAYEDLLFLLVIIINILLGIFMEIRSKRTVEKLSILSLPHAHVIREGVKQELPVQEIVLDDIIVLQSGVQICADSVVKAGEIEVNEALLTGEAEPIVKKAGDTLLSGSFVISGLCRAQVEHIGGDNFATKIAMEAKKYKKFHSELMDSLSRVVSFTSYFIVPVGIAMFLRSYVFMHTTMMEAVTTTSGALLGMLPKGLVLLTTVSLTAGVIKLAQKKTLVQELFCIEALSRVDMLCLDKTGTITQGKMEVTQVVAFENTPVDISEAGGLFVAHMDETNATFQALQEYFAAQDTLGVVCQTPFSSQRKWSSVTMEKFGTVLVGAPEVLLENRTVEMPPQIETAKEEGSRVLLMAFSAEPVQGILPQELSPVAAIVLSDPIRTDARETLDFFSKQGVCVKLISGDNPVTASAVAAQAGLQNSQDYIDMSQLETEEEIEKAAGQYTVFGRVSPVQKRSLVNALKKRGHTVAMIGDGINDVLALKEADCSVAMAAGSDATKQIAKLVLLNSNFASLPSVVMEGRRVVNNITLTASLFMVKTVFSFLLSLITVFTAIQYPFTPVQLSLISSLFVGIPSFFLALEPNRNKVKSNFLPNVLMKSIPAGIAVVLSVVAINLLSPALGLNEADLSMLCVYSMAFVSFFMLLRASFPMTKLRIANLVVMTGCFIGAAWLFGDIAHVTLLNGTTLPIFVVMSLITVPFILFLTKLLRKLFLRFGWITP